MNKFPEAKCEAMNLGHVGSIRPLNLNFIRMKKNMGTIDKVIRILVAVVFAVLYFTKLIPGTFGIILLALAVVFVITSLIGFCPLYLPFGISTAKKKE